MYIVVGSDIHATLKVIASDVEVDQPERPGGRERVGGPGRRQLHQGHTPPKKIIQNL